MRSLPSHHAFPPVPLPFAVWPGYSAAQRCVAAAGSDQLQATRDHLPLPGALAPTPEVDAQTGKAGGSKPRVFGGREGGRCVCATPLARYDAQPLCCPTHVATMLHLKCSFEIPDSYVI